MNDSKSSTPGAASKHWLSSAFHQPGTRAYTVTEFIIWSLVILSSILMILEVFVWQNPPAWLRLVDKITLAVFAVEFTMRVLTYKSQTVDLFSGTHFWRVRTHIAERLLFIFTPLQLLDLLVIFTFLPQLRGLRVLRLLRLLRGVRLFQYSDPIKSLLRTFQENSLLYAFTFSFLFIVVTLGGTSFFLVEAQHNPQVNSISDGIWWALVTVTTVG
ncbi:MAG: ion transporter [Deltaproteobacteria bacterium]|nr:ion transporter [Deltaproteobacteria bacterium]MBN2673022.1 ion transporter [Deltaproteobacteria bacterium]